MSYFRDKPKFGDRLRGKSSDELLQEIRQQFDEDSKSFFEPTDRSGRDPFERHTAFPRGFPFDDDGFGRRSSIRAHLDNLAAQHPELADHLGPVWSDIPFQSSFRNRNRSSGNSGNNNYQGYSDEDARSQASGSSAASGASAVSSHGEPESNHNQQDRGSQSSEQSSRRSQIPQYGLRNTVDIGQHQHNMENSDKGNRGQRSMSAPPENRQSFNQQLHQEQPQQQPQGQRYVSRIDITPQHNQPPQQQQYQQQYQQPQQQYQQPPQQYQQPQQPPQSQQQPQQKPQQQQSNVRHIPIFVEGRDEPVLPRSFDEPHFKREPSPTQFQTPPHFQRSSAFGQPPFGRNQWSPHFQDSFYPPSSPFENREPRRQQQTHGFQHPRQQPFAERHPQQHYTEKQPPQQHYEQPRQQQRQQPQQQQQQPQEPPKPAKPPVPKDPLERVALVQKEVDSLAEQVKQYSGNSRTDKEYIYLDEMLTRELIKLDDIETEGRENVRQSRKNAIKSIQQTISLLESKAPLPSQSSSSEKPEKQEDEAPSDTQLAGQAEPMDVDQKTEQPQNQEPIPLPPVPSSLSKKPEEPEKVATEGTTASNSDQPAGEQQKSSEASGELMDTAPTEKTEAMPMEVQQVPEQANIVEEKAENAVEEKKEEVVEGKKQEDVAEAKTEEKKEEGEKKPKDASKKKKKKEDAPEEKKADVPKDDTEDKNVPKDKPEDQQSSQEQQQEKPAEEKMEVESEVKKSPKTPKKTKKTKKQTPVSEEPIPLPAPEGTEASAK